MIDLVLQALPVLQSSDGGGGGLGELALLLAGPAGGAAVYGAVHRYYRNADKTDQFEKETRIELKTAISGREEKVDEIRGTRRSRIERENTSDFRRRVSPLDG